MPCNVYVRWQPRSWAFPSKVLNFFIVWHFWWSLKCLKEELGKGRDGMTLNDRHFCSIKIRLKCFGRVYANLSTVCFSFPILSPNAPLHSTVWQATEVLVVGAADPYAQGFQDCGGNTKILGQQPRTVPGPPKNLRPFYSEPIQRWWFRNPPFHSNQPPVGMVLKACKSWAKHGFQRPNLNSCGSLSFNPWAGAAHSWTPVPRGRPTAEGAARCVAWA